MCPLAKILSLSWAEQSYNKLVSALLPCDPAASCCRGLLRAHLASSCYHQQLTLQQVSAYLLPFNLLFNAL